MYGFFFLILLLEFEKVIIIEKFFDIVKILEELLDELKKVFIEEEIFIEFFM